MEGTNMEKYDHLYDHYEKQETWFNADDDNELFFSGLYGKYWPAHFGGGHLKFLKRRHSLEGVYNESKFPWVNWYRRKFDERGISCTFPRGQDYQQVLRYYMTLFMIFIFIGQYKNIQAHFDGFKALAPPDNYPPRINLPFYLYIIHELGAPSFEDSVPQKAFYQFPNN